MNGLVFFGSVAALEEEGEIIRSFQRKFLWIVLGAGLIDCISNSKPYKKCGFISLGPY